MGVFQNTCTLYNRFRDTEGGLQWARTTFQGVSLHVETKAAPDGKGIVTANYVSVTIPIGAYSGGKAYFPRREWLALDDKNAAWTMCEGDLLVPGVCTLELGGAFREAQLREEAGRVFTITGYDDNRKGSPRLRHYYMEAK